MTSFVIFDAIMVLAAFFYDYSASDVVLCLMIGCVLVFCDHVLSRLLMKKNLTVRWPVLLHGADLILPVAAGLFVLSVELGDIPLWLQRPSDPSTRYGIALLLAILIIEALLITERIFLIKLSKGETEP